MLRKLLQLINEFIKFSGHKINVQKCPVFLYRQQDKKKEKLITLFTSRESNEKYLRTKPTKDTKDLYSENYKEFIVRNQR